LGAEPTCSKYKFQGLTEAQVLITICHPIMQYVLEKEFKYYNQSDLLVIVHSLNKIVLRINFSSFNVGNEKINSFGHTIPVHRFYS
jgi:hypothetical protein